MKSIKLIISITQFVTTLALLTLISFAWFSLTNSSQIHPIEVSIIGEKVYTYDITYYTATDVYKYDSATDSILWFNTETSQFEHPPTHTNANYVYKGIIISQYDRLIPENNYANNLIVEVNIHFDNTTSIQIAQSIISDKSIASLAVQNSTIKTSRPYYVSEVTYVQNLVSNAYNSYSTGYNKYSLLNSLFISKDINNQFIYPQKSFYNPGYIPEVQFNTMTINPGSDYRFYYNFSYYETKTNQFFDVEFTNIGTNINDLNHILFFQDVKIRIRGGA